MAKSVRRMPAPRSKAYVEGLKVRRRWLGKAYVDKAFLHVAAYCGAPAALDSFRIARLIFAEQRRR